MELDCGVRVVTQCSVSHGSREWRGTRVIECGAARKTRRAALNSWLWGSGAHTGYPSSLATVNQASRDRKSVV